MREELIRVASGEGIADLLIKNGRVVDVFSGQIENKDVAVHQGIIVGFGDYRAQKILDVKGDFLCPGLIDGHVHIESSMVTVPEFARAVLPNGTTSAVIDPHEIANVLGANGVRWMAESARGIPFSVFLMIPSCVPATSMETSGATLLSGDIAALLKEPWAIGLAEMMNFPGVISRDREVLRKIGAAERKRIDGHAPSLSGKALSAYLVAGIKSDHECTTPGEAKEKLSKGMWIMIREGTAARNLKDLIPVVTSTNARRFFFVTDDRHPKELLAEGHINALVKKAIRLGLDPVLAIQMATLNAAEYFRLDDLGAIAPGFRADLLVFDHLSRFNVKKVLKDGVLVAEEGRMVRNWKKDPKLTTPMARSGIRATGSVRIRPVRKEDLLLRGDTPMVKVIQLVPDQIVTKKVIKRIPLIDGLAQTDVHQDILKIVVVERHRASGRMGLGFVQGFGLRKGALGSTVAHDSHNLVVVGTNDEDILKTIHALTAMGGGLAAVFDQRVRASISLPIAGLMAEKPVVEVHRGLEALQLAAKEMGSRLPDPFMTLSFLSLPVIPELKITDQGIVDVTRFKIVPLFGEG